jgi:uncharacterized alpha-E superfamily protein
MLSRIADSMFWLSRYLERSEGILRTTYTGYILSLDKSPVRINSWEPLINIFSGSDKFIHSPTSSSDILHHVLLDTHNLNAIKVILSRARENARGMQDHITKEVWEQVNLMYHMIQHPDVVQQIQGNAQITVVENLLKNCLLYTGIADSTMPRGMGWCFMNLGKHIERCLITIEITDYLFKKIDHELDVTKDILYWRNLLFSLSGYEFHLKNYRSNDTNLNVAHQVIFHPHFPHSINYSLTRVKKYLEDIISENELRDQSGILRQYGRLYSSVQFADFEWIRRYGFARYLEDTRRELMDFTNNFSQTFFSYSS